MERKIRREAPHGRAALERPGWILAVGLALLLFGLPSTALADYKALYVAGLRAKAEGRWTDALMFFTEAGRESSRLYREGALDKNPVGRLIRPYGTWTESYLPGYYRGLALYHLGYYAQALAEWTEALAAIEALESSRPPLFDHPLTYPRNRALRRDLKELRDAIPGLIAERYRRLRAELERLQARAESLRRFTASRGDAEDRAAVETLPGRLEKLRDLLDARLEEVGRQARSDRSDSTAIPERADRLERDEQTFREALEALRAAEAVRMAILSVDRIRREEEDRDARLALVRLADERLEVGDCETAIGILRRLIRGEEHGRLQPSDRLSPYAQLAEASLDCGKAEAAALYGRLSRRFDRGKLEADLETRLRAAVPGDPGAASPAPRGGVVGESAESRAVSSYLQALAWLATGQCRPEPAALVRAAMETLFEQPDMGEGALARYGAQFAPYMALARASHDCADSVERDRFLTQAAAFRPQSKEAIDRLRGALERHRRPFARGSGHALIISVWDYDNAKSWSQLPGAWDDVEPIRRALAGLGFHVLDPVENPTKAELEKALRDFVKEYGTDRDNRLVVYYAGHGHTWKDPGLEAEGGTGHANGFLVPRDAPDKASRNAPDKGPPDYLFDLFSMEELQTKAGLTPQGPLRMKAHHAMFAFDACFGGALFATLEGQVAAELAREDVEAILARPTRFFLAAGGADQEVPDFSVFRRFLVAALEGDADVDGDGLVLGREMGEFLRPLVQTLSDPRYPTTPQWVWQSVDSDSPGDFGFALPEAGLDWPGLVLPASGPGLESELAVWSELDCGNSLEQCEEYLAIFGDAGWLNDLVRVRRQALAAQGGATNFQ